MRISAWRCLIPAVLLTTLMSTVGSAQEPSLPKTVDVDLGGGMTMTLILIPAGSFEMGSDKGEPREKPVHTVTISKPFYLGKYEVTQEQWQAVLGNNPSHFKGDKLPVEHVSWNDCQEFLKKLQSKVPALKVSLPTEAQWEYACRAGSKTEYSIGAAAAQLRNYGWYGTNSGHTTHDVGGKKPNAWGLYDMHGNVWEWCADWYATSCPGGAQKDPAGPERGEEVDVVVQTARGPEFGKGAARVVRGGSWLCLDLDLRSAFRLRYSPDYRFDYLGFRVAAAP